MVKIALSTGFIVLIGIVSLVFFQSDASRLTQEGGSDSAAPNRQVESDKVMQKQLDVEEYVETGNSQEDPVNTPVVFAPVEYAPNFTLPRIDGQPGVISLDEYRGEKPVIIDFFAPHCPNCRRNIVSQKPLYEKYKDRIEIIIVGIDPEPANSKYFAKNPVAMPVVFDATSQILKDYGVRFTNTHALINKDGSLHDIVYDDLREDYIEDLLR